MMRTSCHSIESIRGDDVLFSFGFSYFILVQLLSCISLLWIFSITLVISQKYSSRKAYKRATRPLLWQLIEWLKFSQIIQLNSWVIFSLEFWEWRLCKGWKPEILSSFWNSNFKSLVSYLKVIATQLYYIIYILTFYISQVEASCLRSLPYYWLVSFGDSQGQEFVREWSLICHDIWSYKDGGITCRLSKMGEFMLQAVNQCKQVGSRLKGSNPPIVSSPLQNEAGKQEG